MHLFSLNHNARSAELSAHIEDLARTHDLQSFGWQTENQVFLIMGSKPRVGVSQYDFDEA